MPIEPTPQQLAEYQAAENAPSSTVPALDALASLAPVPAQVMPDSSVPTVFNPNSPTLSPAQAQAFKEALIAAGMSPETIDAAAKADGITFPTFADPDAYQHTVDPSAYRPQFGAFARELPADRLLNLQKETSELASKMKLGKEIGTAFIEHLAEIALATRGMSDAAKNDWRRKQAELSLRYLGSQTAIDTMRANAAKVLDLAGNDNLGQALKQSHFMFDHWFAATLSNHASALGLK